MDAIEGEGASVLSHRLNLVRHHYRFNDMIFECDSFTLPKWRGQKNRAAVRLGGSTVG